MATRRGVARVLPEPFFIAVALLLVVIVAAAVATGDVARVVHIATGSAGLFSLLPFTLQMCLVLMFGTALGASPPVRAVADRIARLARSPRQLVGLTALAAVVLGLLNWGLAIVGGALVARAAGRRALQEGWSLHYPLLCAAGYAGMMVWHGGLSGSAPLKVAARAGVEETLGPELANRIGAIPIDATLFSTLNLLVTGGLVIAAPLVFMALTPTPGSDPDARAAPPERAGVSDGGWSVDEEAPSKLTQIEDSPWVLRALAALLATGAVVACALQGTAAVGLDFIITLSWLATLLCYRTPRQFIAACAEGLRSCTGIVLQFPLYGAVMGVFSATGVTVWLADTIAGVGKTFFLAATFVSAGVVNLFIPSGGGQWAMQGPVAIRGGLMLGIEPETVVMALSYGDQWTNMLQPFWALALLELTGVRARDIIGYTSLWMVAGGLWIAAVLLLWS